MAKVREQFDTAGPADRPAVAAGTTAATDDDLVETLRGFGVRRFSALAYAHRPGMAEFLNDWALGFADRTPELSAQRHLLPRARRRGVRRRAASPRVPRSSRCTCRWAGSTCATRSSTRSGGVLEDAGTPVVHPRRLRPGRHAVHRAGPGRRPAAAPSAARARDRPPRRAGVRRVPRPRRDLRAGLRRHHDGVHDFFDDLGAAFPPDLVPRLRDLQPKVLLGSDFPNIPYPYASQLDGPGPARPRRRLAARRLLGERRPPLRGPRGMESSSGR